jgi:Fur family peroxide stress response transcriptional regulator
MQKQSKKREAIYELICSTKSHPNADWVYANLKPIYPDLSLATVYRNLAAFRESGVLACVATVNGQERYDGNTAPHSHFICTHCGCVTDVDVPGPGKEMFSLLAEQTGAQIDSCKLHFYGRCTDCKTV